MSNRDILQEIDAVIAHEAARRVVNKSREIVDGLITPISRQNTVLHGERAGSEGG